MENTPAEYPPDQQNDEKNGEDAHGSPPIGLFAALYEARRWARVGADSPASRGNELQRLNARDRHGWIAGREGAG